jgi:cyclopropane-fatty-acyl-phospholipid synthase
MSWFFQVLMKRFINVGTVHVIDHKGRKRSYVGVPAFPEITMRFHTSSVENQLCVNPDLALGEGYMNGDITVEGGSIYDLLFVLSCNQSNGAFSIVQKWHMQWRQLLKKWISRISLAKAKSNVAHHYDLPPSLYGLFLGDDWQYSCAYFKNLENDINTAQGDKKKHLAAKLRLAPHQTVLDIGCGWGGLALHLAQTENVNVVGLTLSEEQHKVATERAKKAGLSDRVQFLLKDYREIRGQYDRVVSVGMFEHVGLAQYKTFFSQVHELLAPHGLALLHSIGSEYDAGASSPWIAKYIFPGGYIPTLSEVLPHIEQERFHVTDIEILHHHYAATLRAWRQRFLANRKKLPKHLDDRFVRMWEYYLAGSEVSFQKRGLMIFQIQLMKNKEKAPLTRDYIYLYENAVAAS